MMKSIAITSFPMMLIAVLVALLSARGTEIVSLFFLSIIFAGFAIIISGFIWQRTKVHRNTQSHSALYSSIAISAWLAILLSVPITHWPLRLNFAFSQNSLDQLAQDLKSGKKVSFPVNVGLFTINQALSYPNGIVCLWTNPNPAGNTSLVQCSKDTALQFNLGSITHLNDRWHFISED